MSTDGEGQPTTFLHVESGIIFLTRMMRRFGIGDPRCRIGILSALIIECFIFMTIYMMRGQWTNVISVLATLSNVALELFEEWQLWLERERGQARRDRDGNGGPGSRGGGGGGGHGGPGGAGSGHGVSSGASTSAINFQPSITSTPRSRGDPPRLRRSRRISDLSVLFERSPAVPKDGVIAPQAASQVRSDPDPKPCAIAVPTN